MAFFLSIALVLAAVFATAVLVAAVFVLLVILILFHVFFLLYQKGLSPYCRIILLRRQRVSVIPRSPASICKEGTP